MIFPSTKLISNNIYLIPIDNLLIFYWFSTDLHFLPSEQTLGINPLSYNSNLTNTRKNNFENIFGGLGCL